MTEITCVGRAVATALLVAVAPVRGVVPGRSGITVRIGAIRIRRVLGIGRDAER